MRTLALIPARTGSKGIPGKNFRDFCGKPLWEWAWGIGAETCDLSVVSSDATVAPGALLRPTSLAQDDTPMLAVVQHALSAWPIEVDVVVLLQPTQPLRTAQHVRDALALLEDGVDSVVSVVAVPHWHHPECVLEIEDGQLCPSQWKDKWGKPPYLNNLPTRRQELDPVYARDGTVYVMRRETIEGGSLYGDDCRALVIPASESCNIDTEDDWRRAEQMMSERNGIRRAG